MNPYFLWYEPSKSHSLPIAAVKSLIIIFSAIVHNTFVYYISYINKNRGLGLLPKLHNITCEQSAYKNINKIYYFVCNGYAHILNIYHNNDKYLYGIIIFFLIYKQKTIEWNMCMVKYS